MSWSFFYVLDTLRKYYNWFSICFFLAIEPSRCGTTTLLSPFNNKLLTMLLLLSSNGGIQHGSAVVSTACSRAADAAIRFSSWSSSMLSSLLRRRRPPGLRVMVLREVVNSPGLLPIYILADTLWIRYFYLCYMVTLIQKLNHFRPKISLVL